MFGVSGVWRVEELEMILDSGVSGVLGVLLGFILRRSSGFGEFMHYVEMTSIFTPQLGLQMT